MCKFYAVTKLQKIFTLLTSAALLILIRVYSEAQKLASEHDPARATSLPCAAVMPYDQHPCRRIETKLNADLMALP